MYMLLGGKDWSNQLRSCRMYTVPTGSKSPSCQMMCLYLEVYNASVGIVGQYITGPKMYEFSKFYSQH